MPPKRGLLKTKRGKATLPLPSACRIEFLSSFQFPPCATPCLVDVNVYVFSVDALDELATNPTAIAAASVMVSERFRLDNVDPAGLAASLVVL